MRWKIVFALGVLVALVSIAGPPPGTITGHAQETAPAPPARSGAPEPAGAEAAAAASEAHLAAARAHLAEERVDEALAEAEAAAAADPQAAHVWVFWGKLLLSRGRHAEALQKFERAGRVDSKRSAELLAFWGKALEETGRADEARRKYEAALERDPGEVLALNNLAVLLFDDESELPRAVELLERALREKPGRPRYLYNLGEAYLRAGRYEEAHDLLQRAVAAISEPDPLREQRMASLELARRRVPRKAAPAESPNLVLVIVDALRADHVGAYGYGRKITPSIDGLAREGVLFEQAISQAPWTAASVASLFTGLYPSVHGLDGGISWARPQTGGSLPFAVQKSLGVGQVTLAEVLRRHGYRTAGFVSNVYMNSLFGFAQGFDHYDDHHEDYSNNVLQAKRRAERTNERVFRWLDSRPPEPFLLLVHYNDPHWPYNPPAPFGAAYVAGYAGRLTPEGTSEIVERVGEPITDLAAGDLSYLIGLYDGEIAYVDAHIGRLLHKIDSLGLNRRRLTVLLADHGEEFLDHGSGSHGYTLYEEQIRIPLVFHDPGRLAPRRVATQVRAIDVMPTVLELAGLGAAGRSIPVQGRSLVPLLDGKAEAGAPAYSEATLKGEGRSVRYDDGLKLIEGFEGRSVECFDLRADPGERANLLEADPARGELPRRDLARWREVNRSLRTGMGGAGPGTQVEVDDTLRDRLRALGYIQ